MSIAEKFEIIADEVYDKGVYDRDVLIYNMITDNETRTNYHNAFQYTDMSGYKFIKTITPTGYINQMFYSSYNMTSLPTPLDFSKILSSGGDTTATYRKSVFAYCRNLEIVLDLNMKAIGGLEEWFIQCRKLHTIELLRVHRDTIYTNTFSACDALQNINFDGEIGKSIDFSYSPISVASMKNIIEHLVDYGNTEKDGTNSVKFTQACWDALDADSLSPDGRRWIEYVWAIGWTT